MKIDEIMSAFKQIDKLDAEAGELQSKKSEIISSLREDDDTFSMDDFESENSTYTEDIVNRIQKCLKVLGTIYIRKDYRIDQGGLYEFRHQSRKSGSDYINLLMNEWPTIMVRIKNEEMRASFHKFMMYLESRTDMLKTLQNNITVELPITPKSIRLIDDHNVTVSKIVVVNSWRRGELHINDSNGPDINLDKQSVGQLKDEIELAKQEMIKAKGKMEKFKIEVDEKGLECFKKWLVLQEI